MRAQQLLLFLRIQKFAATECLVHSNTQPGTKLLPLSCFIPEGQGKVHVLFKTPGGSAEICQYGWHCWICWQYVPDRNIVPIAGGSDSFSSKTCFLLLSHQRGEHLQKRKCLIMLSVMAWLQNHREAHSSHLSYGGGLRAQEGRGLS